MTDPLVALGAAAEEALRRRGAAEVAGHAAAAAAPDRKTAARARVEDAAGVAVAREGADRVVADALTARRGRALVVICNQWKRTRKLIEWQTFVPAVLVAESQNSSDGFKTWTCNLFWGSCFGICFLFLLLLENKRQN